MRLPDEANGEHSKPNVVLRHSTQIVEHRFMCFLNLDAHAMFLLLPKFGEDDAEAFTVDYTIHFKLSVRWSAPITKKWLTSNLLPPLGGEEWPNVCIQQTRLAFHCRPRGLPASKGRG
jgi:hypothetical protein